MSETSTRELDNLIDELQIVREKLRSDGNRIQREIGEHAALNRQVMKLIEIISESLQKLPSASRIRALEEQSDSAAYRHLSA